MRIEYGFISEVDRDDQSNSKDWKFISESVEEFIEFLNDCDDSDATELTSENLSEIWFRINPEWYETK